MTITTTPRTIFLELLLAGGVVEDADVIILVFFTHTIKRNNLFRAAKTGKPLHVSESGFNPARIQILQSRMTIK